MQYIYLLATIPFIITSVIFYLKYKSHKLELLELKPKYNLIKLDVENLSNKIREGYYKETINFMSEKGSSNVDKYDCVVYVNEIDKFINGESKIKLERVEVVSGFDRNFFKDAKHVITQKFSSIRKTSDIEWLESEQSIKELRREKISVILEKLNN